MKSVIADSFVAMVVTGVALGPAFAQVVFHSDVDLVSLSVRVTDRRNRDVRGLGISDFSVFEDGRPRKIAVFAPEEQPITLGVLLDTSSSMAGKKLEQAKAALETLINAGREDNEIFYMEFGNKPGDIVELTRAGRLPSAIGQAKSHRTGTALYDAIAVALCRLRAAHNRRQALLVITDGADQHSRIPIGDLIRVVQSSQAQVFMVGYFSAEESSVFSRDEKTVTLVSGREIDNPFQVFAGSPENRAPSAFSQALPAACTRRSMRWRTIFRRSTQLATMQNPRGNPGAALR